MITAYIRTLIVFLLLIVSMRIMGKRQLGELEPVELVVALLAANLASQPLEDNSQPLLNGIFPVIILLCCQILLSGLSLKSLRLKALLDGKPSVLIEDGKIAQAEMQNNRISPEELLSELRKLGVWDIGQVRRAILEPSGNLSVRLYDRFSPATGEQLGLQVPEPGIPLVVISQGRTITDNLRRLGKNEVWLRKTLAKNGCSSPSQVYLMTLDTAGVIFLEEKK